jgi:hypothetical protein
MSGFGSEDDVRQSLAAGFATHLTKPIDVGQLDEAIARFAPAPAAAAPRGEGRADEPLPGRAAPPIR